MRPFFGLSNWRLLSLSRRRFCGYRAGRTQYDDRLSWPVFRRQANLVARQLHGDGVELFGRWEAQSIPGNGNFAAADTEEAAEVDDRGTHLSRTADDNVDDPPHIIAGGAANVLAEDAPRVPIVYHRRRRPAFRGG